MILKKIVIRCVRFLKKEDITLDESLGNKDLLRLFVTRGRMLLRSSFRGWSSFFWPNHFIFFGKGVIIQHRQKITIGSGTTLGRGVSIDGLSKQGVKLGANVNLGDFTVLKCTGSLSELGVGIKIGSNVGIGAFSYIGGAGGVEIGDDCIMGVSIGFYAENHKHDDITTAIRSQGTSRKGIKIGADCWVGSNAVFLDGCDVGRGCVVAAGSIITKSFPELSIIAGVPARVIGHRNGYKSEIINV
jgi:acetyltransferase-like isoleucine patch superfamily enzyme